MAAPGSSVVVTCCNGEQFLGEQLESIVRQVQPVDEVVFGDDASDDSSVAIAKDVLAGFPGDVKILTSGTRTGLTANLTRCLLASTGEIVYFADHDDVWRPDKVTKISQTFAANPKAELVFSDAQVVDAEGQPTGRTLWALVGFGDTERDRWAKSPISVLLHRTVVTGATMAVRRRLVEAALPLPTDCWHDEWVTLGAVLRGAPPVALSELLVDYRLHGSNLAGLPPGGGRELLVKAGWPRDSRIGPWTEACERFGAGSESLQLRGAIDFARRRPVPTAPVLQRALRVVELGISGDYSRYGQGWLTALHDLVEPALHGRQ